MRLKFFGLAASTALVVGLGLTSSNAAWAQPGKAAAKASCPAVLDLSFPRLQDEKPIPLCSVAGKVTLVVNTASKCGFTQQYEDLEALHRKYSAKGLAILGFPSADFGNQELGSNEQIANFCKNTFGIEFPMFVKSGVKPGSPELNPVFDRLFKAGQPAPGWNFNKYLILPDGQIRHFPSQVKPVGSEIETLIRQHL